MSERDLADLRRDYAIGGLHEEDLDPHPLVVFRRWLHDAVASGMHEPNAMVLSTTGLDGAPASRIVLLKGFDERGLVFYTNYDSAKGAELAAEQRCALLFPWHPLERQVRLVGTADRVAEEESDGYFASRPHGSQLGAWASPQSAVIPDRADLDRRYAEVAARFEDAEVPRPNHWGGYRVTPSVVEFWQGRRGRMHDRLRYRLGADGWVVERLAP